MTDGSQLAALERLMRPKIGRDPKVEKHLTDPAISPGMVRQTKPSHEFLHGAPIDDEPVQKTYDTGKNVPTHSGMITSPKINAGDKYRGVHDPQLGNAILQQATKLGKT